ncbi:hypothetical protein V5799_020506 [Amblyomma americanum]|uniref:Uncharacterized protein n=1 Tax=Amblyomma americanum TaxID=6943 RepID=A0AAQ4EUJ1_AMBAM
MKIPGRWYQAKKNGKIIPEETEAGGHMAALEQRRKEETRAGKKLAEKSVERQRMKIPSDYEKVIMRPQGGLERLMKFGGTYLADAISRAAGIGNEGAGHIITFNLKQQFVLITTGDEGKRNRYMAGREIIVGKEAISVNAYMAVPEDCGRGVIYDAPTFW